jgi:hypothetical protein
MCVYFARWLVYGIGAVFLGGGLAQAEPTLATGFVARYAERIPGVRSTHETRLIVSSRFVRADEGEGQGDYLLFDKATSTLYHVLHHQQQVYQIRAKSSSTKSSRTITAPPFVITTQSKELATEDAALLSYQPLQLLTAVDGRICEKTIVARSMLTKTGEMAALQAFNRLVSRYFYAERARNATPEDFMSRCYLASVYYAAGDSLAKGLPLMVSQISGWRRSLVELVDGIDTTDVRFRYPQNYAVKIVELKD